MNDAAVVVPIATAAIAATSTLAALTASLRGARNNELRRDRGALLDRTITALVAAERALVRLRGEAQTGAHSRKPGTLGSARPDFTRRADEVEDAQLELRAALKSLEVRAAYVDPSMKRLVKYGGQTSQAYDESWKLYVIAAMLGADQRPEKLMEGDEFRSTFLRFRDDCLDEMAAVMPRGKRGWKRFLRPKA